MSNLETGYPAGPTKANEGKPIEPMFSVPCETVDLPSRGLVYPKDSPLSKGQVDIKYMTAKEEDILTTESFIRNNTVIDRFLDSLIVTEGVKSSDLLVGDLDALTIHARALGYSEMYEANVTTPSGNTQRETIDLTTLDFKLLDERHVKEKGVNRFDFKLPVANIDIEFKLLTNKDAKAIQRETDINLNKYKQSKILSTTMYHHIVSIQGNEDRHFIKDFIDKYLRAKDSRALRNYIEEIKPSVDLSQEVIDRETGQPFRANFSLGAQFFWPDSEL